MMNQTNPIFNNKKSNLTSDFEHDYKELIYIISHDLNAPLRQIKAFLELFFLDKIDLNDNQKECRDMMFESAETAQGMLNGLLFYSRLNTHENNIRPLEFEAVLEDIAEQYPHNIACADIPKYILADEVLLKRAMSELMENALKFSEDKQSKIKITNYSTTQNKLVLCIEDNGIGIASRDFKRAFQPLQQLNKSDAYPGYGMGLPIVQKIMHIHLGRVWIESEQDTGTKVFLSFPKT